MHTILCVVLICAFALTSLSMAQTTKPVAQAEVGEMKVRNLQGMTYLYKSYETTMTSIGMLADKELPSLYAACKAKGIQTMGGPVFTYRGADGSPDTKFTLEIGVPVDEKVAAPAGYQVKSIPASEQATVLFTGSISEIKSGWMKLMPAIFQSGRKPGPVCKEYYVYWESAESPNNIVLLTSDLDAKPGL